MANSPVTSEGPLAWARSVWDSYAKADAPWAVLATHDMDQFWQSGELEISALESRGLIRPGDRIADLGCGIGRLSLPLARRVGAVTAIDVSSEMLARLSERAAGQHNLQSWPLQEKGFPPGPFDAIVSFLVLQHQPPHVARDLLARARRALAAGGKMFVDLPVVGWEPPTGAQTLWRDIPASQLWESRLYPWEEAQRLLFEPAGLRVACLEEGIRPDRQMIVLVDSADSEEVRALAEARAAALEAGAVLERYFLDRDPPPGFLGQSGSANWLRDRVAPAAKSLLRRAHAFAFPRDAELRRLLAELCRSAANTGSTLRAGNRGDRADGS